MTRVTLTRPTRFGPQPTVRLRTKQHRRLRTRRACGSTGGRPGAAQPGRRRSGGRRPTVLTDLLTTTLDRHGHRWTEKPVEQGGCDCLDSRGRP